VHRRDHRGDLRRFRSGAAISSRGGKRYAVLFDADKKPVVAYEVVERLLAVKETSTTNPAEISRRKGSAVGPQAVNDGSAAIGQILDFTSNSAGLRGWPQSATAAPQVFVHKAESVLRVYLVLFSCLAVPSNCFGEVLSNSFAVLVHVAENAFRDGVALIRKRST
jgi:hypothetical protein